MLLFLVHAYIFVLNCIALFLYFLYHSILADAGVSGFNLAALGTKYFNCEQVTEIQVPLNTSSSRI